MQAHTRLKASGTNHCMDALFKDASGSLEEARRNLDTDTFWRIWSMTTEKAYHTAAELSEKDAKKNVGRCTLKLIQRVPETKAKEDDRMRKSWSYAARRCLRQARRCEQIVHRIQAKKKRKGLHPTEPLLSGGGSLGNKLAESLLPELAPLVRQLL